MTTRKAPCRRPGPRLGALLAGVLIGGAGCATPGPLHLYTISAGAREIVRDLRVADGEAVDVPSFLGENDGLTGFAYDPFTDHFFLRLAPGNRIRVIDRPARAIKREFRIDGAPESGGGDMAVRPRDGRLFLVHPARPAILECTRLGKLLRTIPLEGLGHPAAGIAIDPSPGRLLVLHADGLRVTVHDFEGRQIGVLTFGHAVAGSLGFDAERREFYAPLRAGGGNIAVFDETGRMQRTAAPSAAFVDPGPRSLIRVF